MKMESKHLRRLADAIAPLDTDDRRAAYRRRDFPRSFAVQDLDKRYRWDLWWSVSWNVREDVLASGNYNDDHLDTALRRIVPAL